MTLTHTDPAKKRTAKHVIVHRPANGELFPVTRVYPAKQIATVVTSLDANLITKSFAAPGTIGVDQLVWVTTHWGEADNDGTVNMDDLLDVINHWGDPLPAPPSGIPFDPTYGYVLDGYANQTISNAIVQNGGNGNLHFAIQVNNGAEANNITIHHMDAVDLPAYIGYFGGGTGITIDGLNATAAFIANQCSMRYGSGEGHRLINSKIDNSKAINDLLRVYGSADLKIENTELIGGRINVSWPAGITGGSAGGLLIMDNVILTRKQQPTGSPNYGIQLNCYSGGEIRCTNVKRRKSDGTLVPITLADIDGDHSKITIT